MTTVFIDTYRYYKRLESAGFTPMQADALVYVMRDMSAHLLGAKWPTPDVSPARTNASMRERSKTTDWPQ